MAAAAMMGLVRELLRPQGTTTGTRRLCGTAVGVAAGFLSAATVASASDGGSAGAACPPAYPWSPQDGARGGRKVFMQSDCAACHSGLPYAGLAAAGGEVEAQAAEIVVVHHGLDEAAPAPATTLHGGACRPDLSVVVTKMLQGLRRSNLHNADGINKAMAALPASPVWLQFLQPYMRSPQAA